MNKSRRFKEFISLLVDKIITKNLFTESAALSYYFALSLVPFLLLTLSALSLLGPSAISDFSDQVTSVMGKQSAELITNIIKSTKESPQARSFSEILGLCVLLFSASSVFVKLKEVLSNIFEDALPDPSVKTSVIQDALIFIKDRGLSIILMMGLIITLVSTLFVSILISFLFSTERMGPVAEILNQLISFTLYTGIFSLVFYFGPKRKIAGTNALIGGSFASIGFIIGKVVLAEYLSRPSASTSYGIAGSFIVLLIWVYYSSFIFFVSAIVTKLLIKPRERKRVGFMRSKKFKALMAVVVILILFRAFLPEIIKKQLNDYMGSKMDDYVGHIEDFDLSLYRGAYQVEGFTLKKKNGNEQIPFVSIKGADISVSWKALFQGRILADLVINDPRVDFLDSKDKKKRQFGVEEKPSNFLAVYKKIIPFSLETLTVNNGEVHFQNSDTKVPIDIYVNKINLDARNIHNTSKDDKKLFSTYQVSALAQNQAKIRSKGSFNLLSKPLAFNIDLELEKLKLTEFNKFLLQYGPFDVTKGTFYFYTELASKNNKITGYVKPILENVDVISGKEDINSLKRFGFEFGTAFLNLFFRDGKMLTTAAKIPIEGSLDKPQFGLWEGFKSALANAFTSKKVEKKLDNNVNLKDVDKKKK